MKNIPTSAHSSWAIHLRQLVGGEIAVNVYYDELKEYSIPILTSENYEGIVAATIGLMDIDQSKKSKNNIFTEIIMDQRGHDERISNILATIAFYIIKDGWTVAPGTIFGSIAVMNIPETKLPLIYFTSPFQWDTISSVTLPGKTIYPLLAIPISEEEYKLAAANSGLVLENLWEKYSVDVLNWNRESVV